METLNQKKRRLYGKQYLNIYISEINNLVDYSVTKSNLISIEITDTLLIKDEDLSIKKRIDFNEKSEFLNVIISKISNDENVFLLTSYYKDCGAVLINSIKSLNTNFNFNDEQSGLIEIIDKQLKNKIILDFYEENGKTQLEIEILGVNWVEKSRSIFEN